MARSHEKNDRRLARTRFTAPGARWWPVGPTCPQFVALHTPRPLWNECLPTDAATHIIASGCAPANNTWGSGPTPNGR